MFQEFTCSFRFYKTEESSKVLLGTGLYSEKPCFLKLKRVVQKITFQEGPVFEGLHCMHMWENGSILKCTNIYLLNQNFGFNTFHTWFFLQKIECYG